MDPLGLAIGILIILSGLLFIAIGFSVKSGSVDLERVVGPRFANQFKDTGHWREINQQGGKNLIIWAFPIMAIGVVALFLPLTSSRVLTILFSLTPVLVVIPIAQCFTYAARLVAADQNRKNQNS